MSKDSALAEVLIDAVASLYSVARSRQEGSTETAARRLLTRLRKVDPRLAHELKSRLAALPTPAPSPAAASGEPETPKDHESLMGLLRKIEVSAAACPVLGPQATARLQGLLTEYERVEALSRMGLSPRASLLLAGPPGVGKTTCAAWLARQLGMPLYQVEIPALISSYLGKTGRNLREVFDFARAHRVVLLMDEFDAIARRRDDQGDMGEVRRTVSVLLKEIEEWPGPSVLVAATNHPGVLDAAAVRRFQLRVDVELPGPEEALRILGHHLKPLELPEALAPLLPRLMRGASGSELRNVALETRRTVALEAAASVDTALLRALGSRTRTLEERQALAQVARSALPRPVEAAQLADWLGVPPAEASQLLRGTLRAVTPGAPVARRGRSVA